MKRIASLAAAALAAGCVSSAPPPPPPIYGDNVIVYSTFQHYDYTGTLRPLTCAGAGVDTVVYAFSDGSSETYPCTDLGQPMLGGFAPGSWWVTVTGYRNGVAVPLYYSGGVTFTKFAGTDAVVYADVQGYFGDLTLAPTLVGWNGSAYVPYASPQCSTANVNVLTYAVYDGAGIKLAEDNNVPCVTDPPTIAYVGSNGIDLDVLYVRMQAWQTGGTTPVMDSCTLTFPHYGNDVAPIDVKYPIPTGCQ